MGVFICGDGARLDEVLVDAHQSHNVATGHVLNGLYIATHHQNCPGEKEAGGEEEEEEEEEEVEIKGEW